MRHRDIAFAHRTRNDPCDRCGQSGLAFLVPELAGPSVRRLGYSAPRWPAGSPAQWQRPQERGRGWVYQVASEARSNALSVRKFLSVCTKRTPDGPNRAAQGGESTSDLATRPASRAQAPHSTPTSCQLFYMPDTNAPEDPQQTRDGGPRRTTEPRDIPLSSAAQLRAPPRLPHYTFSSSDVTRRKPPARAASGVEVDGGPRVQIRAPRPCCPPRGPPGASIEAGEAEI